MTDGGSDRHDDRLRIGVVLFEGFELLDVCGPLEMFGRVPERFRIDLVGPTTGPVSCSQGPRLVADHSYREGSTPDIVFVPGGMGTRRLVNDSEFLTWLADWASPARYMTSVCTGSGVLAAAGLLDGFRATSNKRSFEWARSQSQKVQWVHEARWVEDRSRWTSSGVAAGMDMALALIAHQDGEALALEVAESVEYEWHRDPTRDPFAAKNRFVS